MLCSSASANIVNAIHKFDSTSLIMLREQVYQNNSEWPPVTRNYLSRRGTVEATFLMCVDLATAGRQDWRRRLRGSNGTGIVAFTEMQE